MEWQAEPGRRCPWDPPGWTRSWRAALLAASIFSSSFLLGQGLDSTTDYDISISKNPPETLEGQNVNLTLQHEAAKFITCSWYRGTEMKENVIVTYYLPPIIGIVTGNSYTGHEAVGFGCSLLIKNLNLNDTGTYMVIMNGPAVHGEGLVNIQVLEFVPKLNVVISPSPFVVEFQAVQLRCNTTITQSVSWLKNKLPLTPDYNLTDYNRTLSIDPATRKDTAEYQCQVSNGVTTVTSDSVYFSVIYGPEVPVIHPNNVCNKEGQTIILNCLAASCPGPQYTWYRDGNLVDSGPELIIENFTESQAGIYVCKALNELLHTRIKSDGQHICLEKSCVHDVTITGPSEGTEGQLISLNCTAEGDDILYSWFKESQPVDENTHVHLINNHQTLVFNPCNRNDAAQYTCYASNSSSSDVSAPHRLDIIYGPDTPFISETVDINLYKITLSCVVVAFPAADILWFYNGVQVEENPSVIILDINPEHSGNYTCRARNPISGMQRETTLEIDMIGRLRSLTHH